MKVSIALFDLENLLKTLAPRPKAVDTFTLSACAARVFVECKGDIGGIEALVFEDGAVTLPTKKFRELLKTYKGRQSLTVEHTTRYHAARRGGTFHATTSWPSRCAVL